MFLCSDLFHNFTDLADKYPHFSVVVRKCKCTLTIFSPFRQCIINILWKFAVFFNNFICCDVTDFFFHNFQWKWLFFQITIEFRRQNILVSIQKCRFGV
jgi:hypothetical protein